MAAHATQKISERLACFGSELLFETVGVLDAIDAEAAEVGAQLAPGSEGPGASPKIES